MTTYYKNQPYVYEWCAKKIFMSPYIKFLNDKNVVNEFDIKFKTNLLVKLSETGCPWDDERFCFSSVYKKDKCQYQTCFCTLCGEYLDEFVYTPNIPNKIKCECE